MIGHIFHLQLSSIDNDCIHLLFDRIMYAPRLGYLQCCRIFDGRLSRWTSAQKLCKGVISNVENQELCLDNPNLTLCYLLDAEPMSSSTHFFVFSKNLRNNVLWESWYTYKYFPVHTYTPQVSPLALECCFSPFSATPCISLKPKSHSFFPLPSLSHKSYPPILCRLGSSVFQCTAPWNYFGFFWCFQQSLPKPWRCSWRTPDILRCEHWPTQ
jgi:hypothetical protein